MGEVSILLLTVASWRLCGKLLKIIHHPRYPVLDQIYIKVDQQT